MESIGNTSDVSTSNTTLTDIDLSNEMSLKVIPVTGFILIISVLGLFGNVLIIIVYTKYYRKSNFRYFVLCFAYIDVLSCITTLPAEAYAHMNWFTFKYDVLCKIKSYLNVLTIFASALTFMFLASDRYRKICHPFLIQIQPKLALKMCVALVIVSGILASPTAVFWGKQTYRVANGNVTITVTICEKSEIYADGVYPLIYISSIFVLPVCSSMLFTVILNIMIARKLIHGALRNSVKRMMCLGCEMEHNQNAEEVHLQADGENSDHDQESKLYKSKHSWKSQRHHSLPAGKLSARSRCCQQFSLSTSSKDSVDVNENGNYIPSIMETIEETHLREPLNSEPSCAASGRGIRVCSGNRLMHGLNKCHIKIDTHSDDISSLGGRHIGTYQNKRQTEHRHTIHSSEVDISKVDSTTLMGLQQWKIWRQRALMRKALNSRRKTLILMILSSVFILTMLIYFSLVILVADRDGILRNMSTSKTVVFFFFWRLYFINSLINPILYGLLDERFRKGLRKICCNRRLYRH